jgi:hypothetical protein
MGPYHETTQWETTRSVSPSFRDTIRHTQVRGAHTGIVPHPVVVYMGNHYRDR